MEQNDGPKCAQHERLIEYFCQDDEVSICSRCYIMGDHKNHAILSFEEKNKSVITSIEIQLEKATIVFNRLSKLNKSFLEKRCKVEKNSFVESISQTFQHLHDVLRIREKQITDEVSDIFKNQVSCAKQQIENIKNEKGKIERALQESRQLLENHGMVIDGDSLLKTINDICNIPCILSDSTFQLKLDKTRMEDIADAIQSFGSVAGDKEESFIQLKTVDESPESVDDDDKIFKMSVSSDTNCDTQSISSGDTGEDVIIESDTASIASVTTTFSSRSSRSSTDKELVLPQVKGALKQVNVTHICSPNDFYVQLLQNKNKLEIMSQNMNGWCRKKSSEKHIPRPNDLIKGMTVVALYSADNQWYRARVIDVDVPHADGDNDVKIHVIYYDFGNEEKVSCKHLRKMQPRFQRYSPFCIRCSLFDVSPFDNTGVWDSNSIHEFFRITQHQILLLNVIAMKGPVYEVDLVCMPMEDALDDNFSSVRDMLIFLGLGRFANPSQPDVLSTSAPRPNTVNYFKPTSLPNGDTIEMIVTEASSPSDFYIVPNGEEYLYYLNMMDKMQEVYGEDAIGLYTMHCPRKDNLCVVKGSCGKWYRGKTVSEPKHRKVTVFLVDVGSTEVVSFDRLKKLLSDFIKLPSQAVHCKLADVGYTDTASTDWSHDAKVWCQKDLKGSEGTVRIVRWGQVTEVVLWMKINNRSVNSLLVEAGLVVSTGPSSLPTASTTAGHQPDATDELQNNKTSRNQLNSKKKLTKKSSQLQSGSSQSTPTNSPSSLATEIAVKSRSPVTSPRKETKGRKSASAKEKSPSPRKSKQIIDKSKTHTTEKEKAESYAQILETARKKRIQEDIHKAMGTSAEKRDGEPHESTYIEIVVSYFKSPTNFYIRVKENEDVLEELMEELNQEYKDSIADASQIWNLEDFCVVRISSNGLWYRGKINAEVSSTEMEVELIDYGQTSCFTVDDLRPLTHDLGTRLHRAAVRCHLASLIPTGSSDRSKWSQTAIEFITNIFGRKKLFIKTEGEPTEDGLPIDIIYEEEIPETAFDPVTYSYHSLRQSIMEKGLAMLDKTQKLKTPSPTSNKSENPLKQEIMLKASIESKDLLKEVDSGISQDPDVENFPTTSETPDVKKVPDIVEVPPYAIPDLNEEIEVVSTYVDSTCVIYAQRVDWDDQIAHLSEELQRVYEDSSSCDLSWSAGHVCVVPFVEDGMWYRGLIEDIAGDKAKIFYMDFGNTAWVTLDQLREMHSSFAKYHVQVYHCVLEDLVPNTQDGQWPVPLLNNIHESIVNVQCSMTYVGMEADGRLKIKLRKPEGQDLSSYLLENGHVLSTMDLKDQFSNSQAVGAVLSKCALSSSPDVGGVGSVFKAVATEVELPNIVYVQRIRVDESDIHDFVKASEIAALNKEIDNFEKMMEDINKTPSSSFIKLPDVGVLCLGKFHFDNVWYRAVCVEKYSHLDSCLVTFVDYGTSEIVTRDALRNMPSEFWDLSGQGIRCHLNLLPPGGPDAVWRKNSMDAMVSALAQKELMVKIIQMEPLTVELFVETVGGMSLAYEEVIQKGLALLPMQVDMNVLMGQGRCRQGAGDVEFEENADSDEVDDQGDGGPSDGQTTENTNQNCAVENDGLKKECNGISNEKEASNGLTDDVKKGQQEENDVEDDEEGWTTETESEEIESDEKTTTL